MIFTCRARSCRHHEAASRFAVLAPIALLLAASVAAGQPASLSGKITTSVGDQPLPNAQIKLIGTKLNAITAELGEFKFDTIPAGKGIMEVNLPGYTSKRFEFSIAPGGSTYVHIELSRETTVVLQPVEVKAEADPPLTPAMQGFEARRLRGVGTFFDRAEIGKMQVRLFTDILRRVPGMSVQAVNGPYGGGYSIQTGRAQGLFGPRTCPILYYMNGSPFPLNGDVAINNYVGPDDVLAVEVYTGSSQIPPQFSSSATNSLCGLVLIWTRSGSDRKQ